MYKKRLNDDLTKDRGPRKAKQKGIKDATNIVVQGPINGGGLNELERSLNQYKGFRAIELYPQLKDCNAELKRVCDRYREIRTALGLTQRKMAKAVGVTSQLFSMVETGKAKPSYSTAKLIEYKYGVRAEWLLYGEGSVMVDKNEDENQWCPVFDHFPEIKKALNMLVGRLDLEGWFALNVICRKINQSDGPKSTLS